MNWKALVIGITCEIIFNLLGIDELIDVTQYLETKALFIPDMIVMTQINYHLE